MIDQNIPVVTAGPKEETGETQQLMAELGIPRGNFANDEDVKQFFQAHIQPIITNNKQNRLALEEEWRAIENMEMMKHDDGQRYIGRSNVYLPMFNRSLNSLTSNLVQGLFPSDEYLDVSARNPAHDAAAKATKDYLQWEFDHVAMVRQRLKPALRQLLKFGTSPIKFWYQKDVALEGRAAMKQALDGAMHSTGGMDYAKIIHEGFRVSPRNLFHTYVFPASAADADEASMVYETIELPKSYIEEMERKGKWVNVRRGMHVARDTQFDFTQGAELQILGEHTTPANVSESDHPYYPMTVTEIWTRMPVPKKYLLPGESREDFVPVKLVVMGDVILNAERNPFWHQKPPYRFARMNVKPGWFYGDAYGRTNRAMQYLANDFMNQTNDCGIYSLNPILKLNPSTVVGPLPKIRPGAVWKLTDINGAAFDRPPVEMLQYGIQMVQSIIGMGQDFGGAPPVLQGSKGARTATASQLLQRNAMAPLQDIIEDIELDVMIPLVKGCWSLAQQYRDDEIFLRIAGANIRMRKEQLAIDAEFMWLASGQAANQAMRNQQLMQFMQAVMPVIPLLQAQGKMFDPTPLLQRIYSEGFGMRGFDQVVKPIPMPPMPPPGMGPSSGMGPPPGTDVNAPGNRVRSPSEQAEGAPPSEEGAEDFMETRMEADPLAAMLGMTGGAGGEM